METLILLNKPYGVVCQFSPSGGRPTLKDFVPVPAVYPAGRLDTDSEGLVLLTADGALQAAISSPRSKQAKVYFVQVEGVPGDAALASLSRGVELNDGMTRPARARRMEPPADLWPRDPPIRMRKSIPDSWIELAITEGRNRQVRRMTAAVGFPTLRLVRWSIASWSVENLAPGEWREVEAPPRREKRRNRP